jgi:hypothetical protein
MTDTVRKQIRAAAVTALGGLTTTGAHVFDSRVYPMQDAQLPALRIDTADEQVAISSMGAGRLQEHMLELIVQACVKENDNYRDTIDTIIGEVEIAIAANQGIGGAKYVQLKSINVAVAGEGEKPVAVATLTFEVFFITALGAPTVAL